MGFPGIGVPREAELSYNSTAPDFAAALRRRQGPFCPPPRQSQVMDMSPVPEAP
jgi:hypothetical protein